MLWVLIVTLFWQQCYFSKTRSPNHPAQLYIGCKHPSWHKSLILVLPHKNQRHLGAVPMLPMSEMAVESLVHTLMKRRCNNCIINKQEIFI